MAFDPNAARSGAVLSTNPVYLGAWICYINGIEVPIIGFDVDSSVWAFPTFQIYLIPDPVLQRLGAEDRVQVALFYLDHWYHPEKPEFRLLADGEIIGWAFSNAPGSRSISFTCVAHARIFEQLYFYYMTNVDDIVASRSPDTAATSVATTPGPFYPYGLFHQGLTPTSEQAAAETAGYRGMTPAASGSVSPSTPIQAPYEFVTNVIRGCISKQVPDTRRAVPMMNFFGRWIRTTNFHNRWVRLPLLEDPSALSQRIGVFPIFNAARNSEALTAMQRHVSSQVGNSGSIWSLFQQVLGLVYMEIGMISNPCSVLVQLNDQSGGATSNPTDGRILGGLYYTTEQRDQRSIDQRDPRAPVPEFNPAPQGPVPLPAVETELYQAHRTGDGVRLPANQRGGVEMGVNPATPVRLAQYYVKPQNIFGEPPACNVIFPSMISEGWGFDENFANQPTRTYVNDSVMTQLLRAQGQNREFMLHALSVGYPPEAHALLHHRAGSSSPTAAPGPTESGKNLLVWPEEFYKGPVVSKVALPAWFQMLRQFSNAQTEGAVESHGAPGTDPSNPAGGPINTTPVASVIQSLTPGASASAPVTSTVARRGGRVRGGSRIEETASYPHRWILPATTEEIGRRQRTTYTVVHKSSGANGLALQSTDIVEPGPGTKAFCTFLYARFPDVFNRTDATRQIGLQYGTPPVHQLNAAIDDHRAGMALDLMIPMVNGLPNLAVGTPVANWLVENAQALGIAYIIYARTIWGFGRPSAHYRRPSARLDHFDHIHVTLEREVALGRGGILSRYNPIPFPSTATTTVVRRTRAPASTLGAPGTAPSTPRGPVPLSEADFVYYRPGAGVLRDPASSPGAGVFWSSAPLPGTRDTSSANQRSAQPPTLVGGTATLVGGTATEGDSFAELFGIYAQYEYTKARYAQRTASAQLHFNPYLVVGFPGMIFDAMSTAMHAVGYVQRVGHRGMITQGGARLGTTVQFSYARTFYEFLSDVKADAYRFAARVTSAPADIIPELREVFQDETSAETFYSLLLHGGRNLSPVAINQPTLPTPQPLTEAQRRRAAAFRWDEAIGYAEAGGRTSQVVITGRSTQAQVRAEREGDNSTEAQPFSEGIDPNRVMAPRENGYAEAFASYDVAMQYAARPCCTLDEYIRFWHGGKTIGMLQSAASGQVGATRTDFAYAGENVPDVLKATLTGPDRYTLTSGERQRLTAAFYDHIYVLRPGPGPEPTAEQRGYTDPPDLQPSARVSGLPANYPQTRADWSVALRYYREKVRNRVSPAR